MDRTHIIKVWLRFMEYLKEVLFGLDYFGNALFGGSHKETISSRVGKLVTTSPFWFAVGCWINTIFFLQKDHVRSSIRKNKNQGDT